MKKANTQTTKKSNAKTTKKAKTTEPTKKRFNEIRKDLRSKYSDKLKSVLNSDKSLLGAANKLLKLHNSRDNEFRLAPEMVKILKSHKSIDFLKSVMNKNQLERFNGDIVTFYKVYLGTKFNDNGDVLRQGVYIGRIRLTEDGDEMSKKFTELATSHMFKLETMNGVKIENRKEYLKKYDTQESSEQLTNRFSVLEVHSMLINLTAQYRNEKPKGTRDDIANIATVLNVRLESALADVA